MKMRRLLGQNFRTLKETGPREAIRASCGEPVLVRDFRSCVDAPGLPAANSGTGYIAVPCLLLCAKG